MRLLGGAFGVILGVLRRSWRLLGRLGGVLAASWDVWECLGMLRSVRPFLAVSGGRTRISETMVKWWYLHVPGAYSKQSQFASRHLKS